MRAEKHIRVAVGLLKRGDSYLIAERPQNKPYSGYWEFPGGKIENNELSLDALKRELHEELGITVLSARHCFDHTHRYPDKTVLLEIWLVTDFLHEPRSRENQVLAWVTFDEMISFKLLEGNYVLLDAIKQL